MNNFTKRCVAAFASLTMAGTLCAAGAVTVSSVAWGEEQDNATPGVTGVNNNSQQPVYKDAPWKLSETDQKADYFLTVYKWENE
ncbi:peptidase, partial [Bifidobacteriaceae bacterium WP012]